MKKYLLTAQKRTVVGRKVKALRKTGELPATVIADCVIRLIPNVLPKEAASKNESYSLKNIKEAPQYTRPSEYRGFKVPEILKGGNHRKIDDWNKTHPK